MSEYGATQKTMRVKLGQLLSQARKRLPMSQAELAQKLFKPQSFVSKFESGERRIDVFELIEICSHLDVDPRSILGEFIKEWENEHTR